MDSKIGRKWNRVCVRGKRWMSWIKRNEEMDSDRKEQKWDRENGMRRKEEEKQVMERERGNLDKRK